MADKFKKLVESARGSKWGLKKFNFVMGKVIPFNKPHKIEVLELTDEKSKVKIPYVKKNFNHIKGTHACGLATVGEYCAGLLLLSNLSSTEYRLIMKSLHAEYHYQARMDCVANYELSNDLLVQKILTPLLTADAVYHTCVAEINDVEGNKIATITTEWQIKNWKKVKLKV